MPQVPRSPNSRVAAPSLDAPNSSPRELTGSELFLGLIAPIGTDSGVALQALERSLREFNYRMKCIRLIDEVVKLTHPLPPSFASAKDRYDQLIALGNDFRRVMGSPEAVALAGISAVHQFRKEQTGSWNTPVERHAYVFASLKRPEEASALRRIYGEGIYIIGLYSPRDSRADQLAQRFARSQSKLKRADFLHEAYELIGTDSFQGGDEYYGQSVQRLFSGADYRIDATADVDTIAANLERLLKILFGFQFVTPSRDEYAMAHASVAGYRSADLSRQVGATITTAEGDLLAVGCNEVPRPGGGQYWEGDKKDQRDFKRSEDTSYKMRRLVLDELVRRLADCSLLRTDWSDQVKSDVAKAVDRALVSSPALGKTRVMQGLEYVRAVHAEMAALLQVARLGISVAGTTLYTTTFPCHECTRHIVASGVARVVYGEAYPKSMAEELFDDSISIERSSPEIGKIPFEPYLGVSPTRYGNFFEAPPRAGEGEEKGHIAPWNKAESKLRFPADHKLYTNAENGSIKWLKSNIYKWYDYTNQNKKRRRTNARERP